MRIKHIKTSSAGAQPIFLKSFRFFWAMTARALLVILQANSDRSTPIFASIHSRGRTAKSGTGVTEITPVPKNLNFAFCLQSVRGLSVSFSFALILIRS